MGRLRHQAVVAVAAVVLLAVAFWLFYGKLYLNYDAMYVLGWGDELREGRMPDYELVGAPTPHPLFLGVSALLSVFGSGFAYDGIVAIAYLSLAGLVCAVFALGRETWSWPAGLAAAMLVATSYAILARATAAFQDITFVALVAAAGVLEVRKPRRGLPVLGVLSLAGLIRPEAWLLAGLYWVYLWPESDPRRRLVTAAVVASAPVLWVASDLVITGELLHSFTGTRDATERAGRTTGLSEVPGTTETHLRSILRLPGLAATAVGLALAARFGVSRSRIPLALLIVGTATFVVLGAAGLPLNDRYMFLPAVMLALFAGVAAFGWHVMPAGRERTAWMVGGSLLAVALAASLAQPLKRMDRLRGEVETRARIIDDLGKLASSGDAAPLLRSCGPIAAPNHRPGPFLAHFLDRAPDSVADGSRTAPTRGLFLNPSDEDVADEFVRSERDKKRLEISVPRGFRFAAGNRSWALYQLGC